MKNGYDIIPDFATLFGETLTRVDAGSAINLISPRVAARLWRIAELALKSTRGISGIDGDIAVNFEPSIADALRKLTDDLASGTDPIPFSEDEATALTILTELTENVADHKTHPWHDDVEQLVASIPVLPADEITKSGRYLAEIRLALMGDNGSD